MIESHTKQKPKIILTNKVKWGRMTTCPVCFPDSNWNMINVLTESDVTSPKARVIAGLHEGALLFFIVSTNLLSSWFAQLLSWSSPDLTEAEVNGYWFPLRRNSSLCWFFILLPLVRINGGKNNLSFFFLGVDYKSMGQNIKRASEMDLVYNKYKAIFITRMSHRLSVHCLCVTKCIHSSINFLLTVVIKRVK